VSTDPIVLVLGAVVPRRRPGPLFTRRRILIGAAALTLLGVFALLLSGEVRFGTPRAAAAAAPDHAARAAAVNRGSREHSANRAVVAATTRVADAAQAANLFAPHNWHVEPPPPPPSPPAPPAPPTAPPFPYAFLGAYTSGDSTVYFLSRADRVVDAHIGDKLDGVYEFESADANQLIFNYLPLNIRQSLSSGGNP
jgi:hypothetical protein